MLLIVYLRMTGTSVDNWDYKSKTKQTQPIDIEEDRQNAISIVTSATKEDLLGEFDMVRRTQSLPEKVKQKGREEVIEAREKSITGRGNCIRKGPEVGRNLAGGRE